MLCVSGSYSQLLDYIIFAVLVFYILTIIGLFVLRVKRPEAPWPYKALGYPVLPALYIVMASWICIVLLRYKPQYTWPGLVLVLLGIPVYLLLVAAVGEPTYAGMTNRTSKHLWRNLPHSCPSCYESNRCRCSPKKLRARRTHTQALTRSGQPGHTRHRSGNRRRHLHAHRAGCGSPCGSRSGTELCLAGLTCAFAGLCYAEFASIIPIAGSAYTYGYATLGELVAWIIGWDLTLEYAFGASTVASGWAGYFNSLLQQFHIYLPPQITATPGTPLVFYHDQWLQLMSLPPGVSDAGLPHATGVVQPDCRS